MNLSNSADGRAIDFQRAIESASIVSRADKKGTITYVNDHFVKLSGYSQEELIGQNHRIINSGFHPKDFWVTMWKTISAGQNWRQEVKNKAKDGSYYWVDTFIMPLLDQEGKVTEFLSIRNDITDKKEVEARIYEEERKKRIILESSLDAFIVINNEGIVEEWNQEAERIFGWSAEQATGSRLSNMILPKHYIAGHEAGLKRYLNTGESSMLRKRIEILACRQSGEEFPVELTVIPYESEGKTYFYSFIRDISERKQKEEELKEREASLKKAQAIASIGSWEMIGEVDHYWSDEMYRIHGLEPGGLKPSLELRLSMVHPEDRELLRKAIEGAVAHGTPFDLEKRVIQPDGKTRWVRSQGESVLNPHTGERKLTGTLLDITDKKIAELQEKNIQHRLTKTLEFAKIGTVEIDLENRQLILDDGLACLLQMSETDPRVIPIPEFIATFVDPADHDLIYGKLRLGTDFSHQSENRLEASFRAITRKGNRLHMEALGIFRKRGMSLGVIQDVSEKRKSESEILKRGKTIETMLSGITDGFFATDKELNFTLVSPVFAALAQMRAEDMVGKNMIELFPFMEGDSLQQTYLEAIRTNTSSTFDHKHPQNEFQVFQISTYPNSEGLFIYYKDVSINKAAERSLRRANQLFGRLSANVPGMIYNFSVDAQGKGHFHFVSNGAKDLFGLSPKTIERDAQALFDLIHPADLDRVNAEILLANSGNIHWTSEFRVTVNGELRWISGASNPYLEENGEHYWYGFMMDITESKLNAQKRLENEQKYRLIIENSGEGILFTTPDGTVLSANPEACRILGYTEEEICKLGRAGLVDPSDPNLMQALRSRELTGFYEGTLRFMRKDGSIITAEVNNRIFKSPNGERNTTLIFRDITHKLAQEREKKELLSRLERLAENVPGFIYQYRLLPDGKSHFPYASKRIKDIYGLHPHEVEEDASTVFDVLHPDDLEHVGISIQESATSMEPWYDQYRVNLPTGEQLWVEGQATPQLLEDGSVLWHGYIHDITLRKKNELELEENRNFLSNLIKNLPGYVYRVNNDPDYTPMFISDQVFDVTGYAASEYLIDRTINCGKEIHPEDADRIWEIVQQAVESRQSYDVEYRIIRKDGTVRWAWEKGKGVYDSENNLKYLEGFVMDISRRKHAEATLRESEGKLNAFFQSTTDSVILLDRSFKIVDFNRVAETYVKSIYNQSIFKGQDVLTLATNSTREAFIQAVNRAFEGQLTQKELEIPYPNGQRIWWNVQYIPIRNEQGEIGLVAFNSTNIDQEKRATQRVLALADNIPDGVIYEYLVHPEPEKTRFTYISQGFEKVFELPIDEVMADQSVLHQYIHPEDAQRVSDALSNSAKSLMSFEIDYRMFTPTGNLKWIKSKARPHRQSDHSFLFEGISLDITRQKHLELIQDLSQQEYHRVSEQLRLATRIAQIGEWEIDTNSQNYVLSREASQIMGLPQNGSLLHYTDFDLVEENYREMVLEAFERCIELGEFVDITLQIKTSEVTGKWIRIIGLSESVHSKKPRLYGLIQDINNFKLKEQELVKLAMIAEKTDNLVIVADKDRKIIWVNQAFERTTEYSSVEVVGKNPGAFLQGSDTDPFTIGQIREKLRKAEPVKFELINYTKSGARYWIEGDIQPVFNDRGELDYFIAIQRDITQRKMADIALRSSEAMFKEMARNVPGAIFRFNIGRDGTTYFSYISDRIYEIFGFSKSLSAWDWEAPINLPVSEQALFKKSVKEALKTKSEWKYEGRIITNSGEYKWFQGLAKPIDIGNETVFNGIVIDITEKKIAEQKLIESEGRFKLATQAANLGVWFYNIDEGTVIWDDISYWIFQAKSMDPRKILKYWRKRIHLEDLPNVEFQLENSIQTGESYTVHYRWNAPDGSLKEILSFGIATRDNTGMVISLTGINQDVTHRMKAERALKESEERFRNLINDLQIGVLLQNEDSTIILNNGKALELLGLDQDQLIGKTSFDPQWNLIKEDGTEMPPHQQPSVLATHSLKPVKDVIIGVYRPKTQDRIWIQVDAHPILDSKGKLLHVIVTFMNVTEIRESQRKLKNSLEEKEILIKEIHHRIKNNLQLISSILYIRNQMDLAGIQDFLENTRLKIRSIAMIHEQLLQTGSIDKVNIADYLGKLINDLKTSNGRPDLVLSFEHEFESHSVSLDHAIYCGLIVNELVTNSIKHAFVNRNEGKIRMAFQKKGNENLLIISDDGSSLPENIDLENSKSMGMQLVDIFIRQIKGTYVIHRDQGTRFEITFS